MSFTVLNCFVFFFFFLAKDIPEAAADTVRLAVGKANLLLSRKMKKFAELIDKNLVVTCVFEIFHVI